MALAKTYIDEDRILNFRGTYLPDWSADENGPLSWRFQRKIAGSGTVGDNGAHVVDLAHYLVGSSAAVNAMTHIYDKTRPLQQGGTTNLGSLKNLSAVNGPAVIMRCPPCPKGTAKRG